MKLAYQVYDSIVFNFQSLHAQLFLINKFEPLSIYMIKIFFSAGIADPKSITLPFVWLLIVKDWLGTIQILRNQGGLVGG